MRLAIQVAVREILMTSHMNPGDKVLFRVIDAGALRGPTPAAKPAAAQPGRTPQPRGGLPTCSPSPRSRKPRPNPQVPLNHWPLRGGLDRQPPGHAGSHEGREDCPGSRECAHASRQQERGPGRREVRETHDQHPPLRPQLLRYSYCSAKNENLVQQDQRKPPQRGRGVRQPDHHRPRCVATRSACKARWSRGSMPWCGWGHPVLQVTASWCWRTSA